MEDYKLYPCAAFVNLKSIEHNYNYIKNKLGKEILCVIKADAYGHGAIGVAKHLESVGAKYFAVANIHEALKLRKGGITGEIVVLGFVPPQMLEEAIANDISLALFLPEFLPLIEEAAKKACKKAKIHLKLETGMNRIGFYADGKALSLQLENVCAALLTSENIYAQGAFSHFCAADELEDEFTKEQFERFTKTIKLFEEKGLNFEILHMCNSAGSLDYPQYSLDMVRYGLSLYGYPTNKSDLKPALEFCAHIVNVKNVKAGETIGYGRTFTAQKDMKIATVSAGYADGVPRALSNKGAFYLEEKRCPIIGRVCMDMTMIDVSGLDAKIGDSVTLFGEKYQTAEDIAALCGTISYEILCNIGVRVPRIYTK